MKNILSKLKLNQLSQIKNHSNGISLGSVPGMLFVAGGRFSTKAVVHDTWIHNNFEVFANIELFYIFSIFWIIVMFFITFINIGLSSLLFLLEVGLLTPIGAMVILGAVPMSSILYMLNAITMEAVVGVIVAITYSKDWKYRDFTKHEVLESSISYPLHIFDISLRTSSTNIKKNFFNSWSFWAYFLHKISNYSKNFMINLIIIFFAISFIFYNFFLFNFFFIKIVELPPEYFYKLDTAQQLISKLRFEKAYLGLSSLKKKFIYFNFFEFFNKNFSTYWFFYYKIEQKSSSIFEKLFYNENFSNNKFQIFDNKYFRVYDSGDNRFGYFENPNALLFNIAALSGSLNSGYFFNNNKTSVNLNPKFSKEFKLSKSNINGGSKLLQKIKNNSPIFESGQSVTSYEQLWGSVFFKNKTKLSKPGLFLRDFDSENSFYSHYDTTDNFYNAKFVGYEKFNNIFERVVFFNNKKKYFRIYNFNVYNNFISLNNSFSTKNLNLFGNIFENIFFSKSQLKTKNANLNTNFYTNAILSGQGFSNFLNYKYRMYTINLENKNFVTSPFKTNYVVSDSLKLKDLLLVSRPLYFKKYWYVNSGNRQNNSVLKHSLFFFNSENIILGYKKLNRNIPISVKNNTDDKRFLHNFYNKKNKIQHKHIFSFLSSFKNNLSKASLEFFYTNSKTSWGCKSKSSFLSLQSQNLPWFDGSDSELLKLDKSSNAIFSDNVYSSELANSVENSDYLVGLLQGVDKNILNNNRILKKNNKYLKRIDREFFLRRKRRRKKTKTPIWKLKINWNYNLNFETLYSYIYKNTNTVFFENKLYLKRTLRWDNLRAPSNQKLLNKYGNSEFNNSLSTVYSPQSSEFGLILTNNNFKNITNSSNLGKFKNFKNTNLKSKLFSFFELQCFKSDNFKNFANISRSFTTINNIFQKKIVGNRFLKSKNYKIAPDCNVNNFESFDFNNRVKKKQKKKLFDISDKKHKIFWSPSDFSNNFITYYEDFVGKQVVSDRFLLTFKKIIKNRNQTVHPNSYRLDNGGFFNEKLFKILSNTFRMSKLSTTLHSEHEDNNSEIVNMVLKNSKKKLTLLEDLEIDDSYLRSSQRKPHTFYGVLWDEYLKQTYGFSLNFLNFENKIKNIDKSYSFKKNIELGGGFFQKNIEKSLSFINKQTGLTKDSELSNIITARLLTGVGFFKEFNDFDKLSEPFENKTKKLKKNFKTISKKLYKSKFVHKKKIKKYFKKKLLKDTISKNKIIKSSIKFLKKYSETPVGFKYNKIKVSDSLPYLKRKFWIKNEMDYFEFNGPGKKSWLLKKNNGFDITNRVHTSRISRLKKNKNKNNYFRRVKLYKKLLKLKNINKDSLFDFRSKGRIKKKSKFLKNERRVTLFSDWQDSDIVNKRKDNTKRSLKKIKTRRNIFKKKFKLLKKTSVRLLRRSTFNKKFNNFKLFFKNKVIPTDIIGGGLYSRSGSSKKIDNLIFYNNIFSTRSNKTYDDFFIFENPVVSTIRSFEINNKFTNNSHVRQNFRLYKNIIKNSKIIENWNNFSNIKNFKTDSVFFENTILLRNSKTKKISNTFKLSEYGRAELYGINNGIQNIRYAANGFDILLDSGFYKNDNNFFLKNIEFETDYTNDTSITALYKTNKFENYKDNAHTNNNSGVRWVRIEKKDAVLKNNIIKLFFLNKYINTALENILYFNLKYNLNYFLKNKKLIENNFTTKQEIVTKKSYKKNIKNILKILNIKIIIVFFLFIFIKKKLLKTNYKKNW